MPPAPLIDERKYAQLLGEVVRRIAVDNPEWTDFNQSDPGVTLVELFAFLADTLLWQIDERQVQRRRHRRRRVALLVVGTAGLGALWWTLKKRAEQQADGRASRSVARNPGAGPADHDAATHRL